MPPLSSEPAPPTDSASGVIDEVVTKYADQLVDLRRDLHAHPELSWAESRTSGVVMSHLEDTGWQVHRVEGGGLVADLGAPGRTVALRADLDALPVEDLIEDPWVSTVPGVAHACGHDVHVTSLIGAGLALSEVQHRGLLHGRVRLIFQPAEEVMPGGALHLLAHGALDDVDEIFGLHCDPSLDVGMVGLRVGPLTGAADALSVRLYGKGGHTSRPHLTEDLTFALAKLVTELPAILSRRLDPRAGASVVWGRIHAGSAHNVIPGAGEVAGTVRMLDAGAWAEAEQVVRSLIGEIIAPYGVTAEISYQRGVPPVVNAARATDVLGRAVEEVLGSQGRVPTRQSLGGEDFGWYLDRVPGAMGRLGTRTPGGPTYDLHQGNLRVDEGAVTIGARVLAEAAVVALAS
ncbi:amidohydrolase [Nocardioides houyundeii]|uniref:amidohydrolase n=1 Tax=Nocardioides houyundeii TaxID=2045452 RepID=UPI000C786291|nr:amidohydrolase [Nocardioides houyundeii]